MGLKRDFFELKRMANDIEVKLLDIYLNYINSEKDFSYYEVNGLLDSYEKFYNNVYKKMNSNISKMMSFVIFDKVWDDIDLFSREMICRKISKRVFGYIWFDVDKYIPVDEDSKILISNKLFPIVKNLSVDEIVDFCNKIKKSACIRVVMLDQNSLTLLQQIFVGYVMFLLSHDSSYKYSCVWTYDLICKNIFKEEVLNVDNNKRVKNK